jgi:hypothetical protein
MKRSRPSLPGGAENRSVPMLVLIAKWEPTLGVTVERVFVQKMKTRWGSCNPACKSIRLNTELAKKPVGCLEYIVVHEMTHLFVRHHDDRFRGLMDEYLPNWSLLRQTLNSAPRNPRLSTGNFAKGFGIGGLRGPSTRTKPIPGLAR